MKKIVSRNLVSYLFSSHFVCDKNNLNNLHIAINYNDNNKHLNSQDPNTIKQQSSTCKHVQGMHDYIYIEALREIYIFSIYGICSNLDRS